MKVAIYQPYYKLAGAEKSILLTAELLQDFGLSVFFVVPREGLFCSTAIHRGYFVKILPPHPVLNQYGGTLMDIGLDSCNVLLSLVLYNLSLARYFRKEKVDLVILNTGRASLIAGLAAKLARTKSLAYTRGHIIHGHENKRSRFKDAILACYILLLPDAIINVSKEAAESFPFYKFFKRKISILHNWVDYRDVTYRQLNSPIRIGCLSSISPHKGIHILIDAFERICEGTAKDVQLHIAGPISDLEYYKFLQNRITSNTIFQRVHFWGFVSNVWDFLDTIDIFVLPSFVEGFSRAILEAMASAKPIVATDVGGASEALINGSSGILVPPGDSLALSQAVRFLMRNPDQTRTLAQNAQEAARNQFSKENQGTKLYSILMNLLI